MTLPSTPTQMHSQRSAAPACPSMSGTTRLLKDGHEPIEPNTLMTFRPETDFLQEVRRLEHDHDLAKEQSGDKKPLFDDDQMEPLVLIKQALDNYKDLLCGLLVNVAGYRQGGAALLLAQSHNEYTVMPWRVPATNTSVEQLQGSLRSQMDTDPSAYGLGVTQVIYAWRLCTKNRSMLLYGTEVSGAVAMSLHDAQGWHQLQPIGSVIAWAMRCARVASSSRDGAMCADHTELKRRYGHHERLGPMLRAMDDRLKNWMVEVNARDDMLDLLTRLGA